MRWGSASAATTATAIAVATKFGIGMLDLTIVVAADIASADSTVSGSHSAPQSAMVANTIIIVTITGFIVTIVAITGISVGSSCPSSFMAAGFGYACSVLTGSLQSSPLGSHLPSTFLASSAAPGLRTTNGRPSWMVGASNRGRRRTTVADRLRFADPA